MMCQTPGNVNKIVMKKQENDEQMEKKFAIVKNGAKMEEKANRQWRQVECSIKEQILQGAHGAVS